MGQSDQRAQFTALLDAHGGALMALIRRLCGNEPDADDVFQETAVRVWQNFANRPWLRNPRSWLMTIGYRTFIDWLRRRQNLTGLVEQVDYRAASPVDLAQQAEQRDRVQAAVAVLPEPIRDVVLLHYVGGLSIAQTAAAMQIAGGTVKSRLNQALTTIRRTLE